MADKGVGSVKIVLFFLKPKKMLCLRSWLNALVLKNDCIQAHVTVLPDRIPYHVRVKVIICKRVIKPIRVMRIY